LVICDLRFLSGTLLVNAGYLIDMEFQFLVFIRMKDCGDVRKYSSVFEMQHDFERIDVENDEYEAWDPSGLPLKLSVQKPVWLRIESMGITAKPRELADAIRKFAKLQDVPVDLSGLSGFQFSAVLDEVSATVDQKRRSKSWLRKRLKRERTK
jgi:hypothetical protein